MRVDVRAPRFSVLQVVIGAVLAAVVMVAALSLSAAALAVPGCTSAQMAGAARTIQVGTRTLPVPVVSDPILQAKLDAFAAERELEAEQYRKERDEAIARGEAPPPEPKMNPWQILTAFLTAGTGAAAAYATARSKAATDTTDVASAVARLLATPAEKRTPEMIAATLSSALPGSKEVAVAEVKAAA